MKTTEVKNNKKVIIRVDAVRNFLQTDEKQVRISITVNRLQVDFFVSSLEDLLELKVEELYKRISHKIQWGNTIYIKIFNEVPELQCHIDEVKKLILNKSKFKMSLLDIKFSFIKMFNLLLVIISNSFPLIWISPIDYKELLLYFLKKYKIDSLSDISNINLFLKDKTLSMNEIIENIQDFLSENNNQILKSSWISEYIMKTIEDIDCNLLDGENTLLLKI